MFLQVKRLPRFGWASLGLLTGFLLAACSPVTQVTFQYTPTAHIERSGRLTPFLSATPSQTTLAFTPTPPPPVPTPSPTPRTHEVQKGEDMFGIALRYGITLDELMNANPDVDPNFLSIGSLLIIPPSSQAGPGVDETSELPSPTPVPLETGPLSCTRSKEGGVWCFLPVRNNQTYPLEGITAAFRLADQDAGNILTQNASLPLDILSPGTRLPLAAYFPPPVPESFQASAEVLSALPSPDDGRYLPVHLDDPKVLLAENALSAEIELQLSLDIKESAARRIWVAAAVYDAQGHALGVRQWEYQSDQPLESGQSLPVRFTVYSVSGKIERVALGAQARP